VTKDEAYAVFKYFYEAYISRYTDLGLTGHTELSINFLKGRMSSFKLFDEETKKLTDLPEYRAKE